MLRLLGPAHVIGEGGNLTDLPEKAFVLMAVLALENGGPVTRERLRALLWEEADAGASSERLRWTLARVRRWEDAHGLKLLAIGRRTISLATGLSVDLSQLLAKGSIDSAEELDDLERWRGELLEGVATDLGTELDELLGAAREKVRRHYVALARDAALRVPSPRGCQLLRDLCDRDPGDESLLRALITCVARDHGAAAARAVYEAGAAQLRRNFDIEPSIETRALIAQLAPEAVTAAPRSTPEPDGIESGIPRIVLLPPLAPLPVDPQAAMIADAMIEDVSLQLCRMRTFAMFAPHTARQVAGLDAAAAVAPFGVGYLAKTMLLPDRGGGLRLTLALIRASTNTVVFGDQFSFDEAQLGHRFTDLTETIAAHLVQAVERVEIGAYRRTGAASAYVQYLLGMKVLDSNDLKALRRARSHFNRALELQPGYVPAITGVARTLSKEALALRRTDADLAARAMHLATRAAEIDPLDPNAYREKALASLYLHDIDASLAYLDVARERAHHHADIIAEKADVLVHASRPAEAKQQILEAMSVNPIPPDDYHWVLGSAEFFLGHYDKAVAALGRMSNTDSVSRLIAAAAAMNGDLGTAARYREKWMSIYPDSRIENFARFMPHASKADVEHYVGALRRAGFE